MILYTVIARAHDGSTLTECSAAGMEGNYPSVSQQLIVLLKDRPSLLSVGNRKTFVYSSDNKSSIDVEWDPFQSLWTGIDGLLGVDSPSAEDSSGSLNHFFHVFRGIGVFCICLSDDNERRQQNVNFQFLNDVMKDFTTRYSPKKIERAIPYGMEKSFSQTISNFMHHYDINRNDLQKDKRIASIHTDVESLQSLMGRNLDLMLRRSETLDHMIKTSESLMEDTKVFAKKSKDLKKVSRTERVWYYRMITAGVSILILYLFLGSFCGFGFSKCIGGNVNYNGNGNSDQ